MTSTLIAERICEVEKMAEMIYANDLKQAMKDAGMLDYVKAEVAYKSAWGVPIVDAEEVVHCKDCKHADIFHQCDRVEFWTSGDDYCSRGERREDG